MDKERDIVEATEIAQKARRALLDSFAKMGHPLTPGSVGVDGHVITDEEYMKMTKEIDAIGLQAILGKENVSL